MAFTVSLYDELGLSRVIANPARNQQAARIANPDSKRGSVSDLSNRYSE